MVFRFLDLHVHSLESTGLDSRAEMKNEARSLGSEISFCDGKEGYDGLEIEFKNRKSLNKRIRSAPYKILKPRSKEALKLAAKSKKNIIQAVLDPALAKSIKKSNCAVEVCLSPLIKYGGIGRMKSIKHIRRNLMLARKYKLPLIATTGARSIYDLRSPYQVFEILRVVGFSDREAQDAMYKNPQKSLETGLHSLEKRSISEYVRKV